MQENHFDKSIAARYDAEVKEMFESSLIGATVEFILRLANGGSVLEFAIGTGRVALPLALGGIHVEGIELSPAMVDQLRQKPGGDIPVTIGDMTTTRVAGKFQLVYLVFNTIGNLTSQERQVECFVNAAEHLTDDGYFVMEVDVPNLRRLPPGTTTQVFKHTDTRLSFDKVDVVSQLATSFHYDLEDGIKVLSSVPFRFVWPSELDLMARIAGMELCERWSD